MAGSTSVQVLSAEECRRRLAGGGVGRISVVSAGVPVIRPVNFVLDGDRIVVRTGDTEVWRAARARSAAEFEIDATRRDDHSGWSVIVSGPLEDVTDVEDHDRLSLLPWAPGERARFVSLSIDQVSGRRVGSPRPSTPTSIAGGADPDHWGRSGAARRTTSRLLDPAYRWWFRFGWRGMENIPRRGGALLVANHAGAVPVDGALVVHGLEREVGRPVYALHHRRLSELPYAGTVLARNGGVVAHPDNALRLLHDEGHLVLVFPEGTKGTTKHYRDRYRLARFGRGGFVETAMRAGVPVVPIAITGTEESMPSPIRIPLDRETGVAVPLTALLLGPLGTFVHLPVRITATVLPPIRFDQPAGLEHYPPSEVATATELVRSRLQAALDGSVGRRTVEP
jgi:1-acyl-sn-glycerol-3-phosphate acyltransferase